MEKFQQLVRNSLNHYGYYNKHEVDFNIKGSATHFFTLTKDADFIISNTFGEIGWIEVKSLSGAKFYVSNQPRHQWARALQLWDQHGTYYYIVHFKDYETSYWFTPDFVEKKGGQFDPREHVGHRMDILRIPKEGAFGKKTTFPILNLNVIPFFQSVQNSLVRYQMRTLESHGNLSQISSPTKKAPE